MVTANRFQLSCHFHKEPFGTHGEMACLMKNIHIFYRLNVKLQHFKNYFDTFELIQPFEGKT